MALLSTFAADRRGVAAMLMALCLMALVGSAATAVDLGDIYMKTRQLQGVADLAAMAAVQGLAPDSAASPQADAQATANLNPWAGGITAAAVTGVYQGSAAIPAAQRFSPGGASPNAVQVTLRAPVPLYFAGLLIGRSSIDVVRTGLAARAQYAAFSIGSGLVNVNGGVANALLSALTGSQVQLTAMNYQALASANIDLLGYLPQLRTDVGLQAVSFDQLLSTAIAPSAALAALGETLNASGQPAAAAAVQTLSAASNGLPAVPLSSLFDLGPYAGQDHPGQGTGASVAVNALGLADTLLAAANGSRQLSLSLDGGLPGVAKLKAWLAIGQRPSHSPWLTVTDANQVVIRTAQTRLYLQAQLLPGALSAATGGALVQLPVYVEVASAQAMLQAMSCPPATADQGLTLSVSPSLGALALGQVDATQLAAFSSPLAIQPAQLVSLPLLSVTATARIDVGGGQASWRTMRFSQAEIAAHTMKSAFTDDVASATLASLLATADVQVSTPLGGLGISPGAVAPGLQQLLVQAAPSLDLVLAQVEALSGAHLGEADVWADGLRCRGSALIA